LIDAIEERIVAIGFDPIEIARTFSVFGFGLTTSWV
jgi:hypothetical protein